MNVYSQLKPAFHIDRIEDFRAGRKPKPVHVQLILSDLCNQDCHFCAYRMSSGLSNDLFPQNGIKNPNRKIPVLKALEILRDCKTLGVKAIQFTGGGEPTVHPHHERIFSLAQELEMDTGLVTNGVRLNPDSDAIRNMTWIRVSVDSGTAETYTRVRRVSESHWHKVWSNIERLRAYKGRLGVGFVVTPDNYKEISKAANLCKDYGVSYMRVGAVFSEEGARFYGDKIPAILDEIEAAKTLNDKEFQIADLFSRRIGDLGSGSPNHHFCGYQFLTIYIGGDLNVYRCCNTAYTLAGKLGSLKNRSLLKSWPKFSYDGFDARNCQFCQFIGQNEIINALIETPEHENFV